MDGHSTQGGTSPVVIESKTTHDAQHKKNSCPFQLTKYIIAKQINVLLIKTVCWTFLQDFMFISVLVSL